MGGLQCIEYGLNHHVYWMKVTGALMLMTVTFIVMFYIYDIAKSFRK